MNKITETFVTLGKLTSRATLFRTMTRFKDWQNRLGNSAIHDKLCWAAAVPVLASLLSACGSGAVSAPPATDPSAGTPVSVSPPSVDAFPDIPVTFNVSGGTSPYQAFSSNNVALPVDTAISGTTFTALPKPVAAETTVDITVRDAANKSTTAKTTIKPSTLNNQVTFTPFGPTGSGCGGNAVCSGGDAQIVVKAVQNGLVLRNRAIRFDVFQGSFQLVTPGSNVLVNSLSVNTDEQGEAVARLSIAAGAATQVATIQTTDTATGLARRYNFNVVQQVSGAGLLTTLPSAKVTFKGAKGSAGQDGFCPGAAAVDYYVFGGTPPYRIASPLPGFASVSPSLVGANGGGFTVTVNGCGSASLIVTDATNRSVETSIVEGIQGDKGDAAATTTSALTGIAPAILPLACGQSATIALAGTGDYVASVSTGGGAGLVVTPSAGKLSSSVTVSALSGKAVTTPATINFLAGATVFTATVNISGIVGSGCP